MWKLLIADDEKTIRRGLRNCIRWKELNITVVGEAEDGEIALEKAKELEPDILFVDICMPFLNGLQLIKAINKILPGAIIIIISGYDEFNYAREAIRLNVFDYLLKPIEEEQLYYLMEKAIKVLQNKKSSHAYMQWVHKEINCNYFTIRNTFFNRMVSSHLSKKEIDEQLEHLHIQFNGKVGIMVIKPIKGVGIKHKTYHFDRELLYFSIKNIIEEMTSNIQTTVIFEDAYEHIIIIMPIKNKTSWYELNVNIEKSVEKYLQRGIFLTQKVLEEGIYNIAHAYKKLVHIIEEEKQYTPVVILAKKYIDQHYYKSDLTLDKVADFVQVNPTYLSRLLKNETGKSFIDYLTNVRIEKSIEFMNDPSMKIYEIAEQVGYNTQHYFSSAFKKVIGVSPIAYKQGGAWKTK